MKSKLLVTGSDLLSEVHLSTKDMKKNERLELIFRAYQTILFDDARWHFFFEMENGDIIRCSPGNLDALLSWLEAEYPTLDIKYNEQWVESLVDVTNNLEYMADIFHLNSEYLINQALKFGNDERMSFTSIIDRISHSMYVNGLLTNQFLFTETAALMDLAQGRAYYDGMRYQYLRDKAYMDSLKDKLEKADGNKNS